MFFKIFAGPYIVVTFLSIAVCKVAEGTLCCIYNIYKLGSSCQCLIFLCVWGPQFFGEGLCKENNHVALLFCDT